MRSDVQTSIVLGFLLLHCHVEGKQPDIGYAKDLRKSYITTEGSTDQPKIGVKNVLMLNNVTKTTRWGSEGMPFSILYLRSKNRKIINFKKVIPKEGKKQYATLPKLFSYEWKGRKRY